MQQAFGAAEAHGAAPAARLTRPMMIAWGIGTLGPVTVLTATNALLLRFMTDIYGVAAGVAASLIAISKFYDVFADVACGVASDRTVSRFGRRRPYLIGGAVLLALSVVAIFAAPGFASTGARTLYMGAILIFYATAYSIFNVPYMAMPGEMTGDYHLRTELMSWRVYAVGASTILATYCGPLLLQAFGGGAQAYAGMSLVFAPIVVGAGVVTFLGLKRAPASARAAIPHSLWAQARSVMTNRPFVALMAVKFVTLMALGVQSIYPFFFQRILKAPDGVLGEFFLSQALLILIAPVGWMWVSRRIGKKATFYIALLISLPVWISWWWASAADPVILVLVRGVLLGATGAGIILMGQSMLPDTMEYDRRRTGLRREGVFAALYTTVEKLSGAIGVALVGTILAAAGYVQSRGVAVVQPASALAAIRGILTWIPTAITVVAMAALAFYDLDEQKIGATERLARGASGPLAEAQGAIETET
jgi:GPH family glycoside/pentoside/hexuronide:cation symporter